LEKLYQRCISRKNYFVFTVEAKKELIRRYVELQEEEIGQTKLELSIYYK